ncbi:DUF6034 family protein [Christensenellaceae bacterium OttesenSCG-928-L17]|nr:DUF6034 family protein [Christensenellaceae bacterium OttesenSCG-928-L17]
MEELLRSCLYINSVAVIISNSKKKTEVSRKMKRLLVLYALATVLITTGCQPTPEADVIIDKSAQSFEPATTQPLQIPYSTATPALTTDNPDIKPDETIIYNESSWEETIPGKKPTILIAVDAVVQSPKGVAFPVIKVRPFLFAEETIEKYCDVFFNGKPTYKYNKLEKITIDDAVKIRQIESDRNTENDRMLVQREAEIQQLLANSVSQRKREEAILTLVVEKGLENLSFLAVMNDDSGYLSRLTIQNDSEKISTSITYERDLIFGIYSERNSRIGNGTPRGMTMLEIDATNIAEELVAKLGIDDMVMTSTYFWTKADFLEDVQSTQFLQHADQCYAFFFSRKVGNNLAVTVAQSFDSPASVGYDGKVYDAVWEEERVVVCVDDDGVAFCSWTSPCNIEEVIIDSAKLMSIDEMKDRFRQQMKLANLDVGDNASSVVHVTRIVLGYTYIKANNDRGAYLLIPVWDFFGQRISNWTDADGYHEELSTSENHSLMTISATDGSIIDRGITY